MEDYIIKIFRESAQIKEVFINENLNRIVAVVGAVTSALKAGNKILLFGNGGIRGGCPAPCSGICQPVRDRETAPSGHCADDRYLDHDKHRK